MKKIIYTLVLMLSFLLTACNTELSSRNYNSFVCDYANDGIITSAEKDWWIGGGQTRQNAELQKNVTYENEVYRGIYKDSYIGVGTHLMIDRYTDTEKGVILYYKSSTEQFSGIHFYSLLNDKYLSKEEPLDETGALEAAKKVVSQYIDVEEYHIDKEESIYPQNAQTGDDMVKLFHFSFIRKINEFDTSDQAEITVTSKGDLFSLNLCDVGLFSEKEIPEINGTELTASIEKKLNDIYSKYSTYSYNIVNQTLTISTDDRMVVVSQIEVRLDDSHNTGVILATEIQ